MGVEERGIWTDTTLLVAAFASGGISHTQFAAIVTALQIIDNIVSGSEAQVDIVAALPAGTNAIGKLAANSGVDIGDVDVTSIAAGTNRIGKADRYITKTIETELKAITAVAAEVQSLSSELDLTGQEKQVTILIDHAKDNASASVGQGTEYVVQVSEKAAGSDTWRSIASFVAAITAPSSVATDTDEAVGQTVIECGATVPAIGDVIFFKNGTIASSEWANVIARVITGGSETFTIESGLTNIQVAGTYFTQGEHFVVTINVESITRLRVVCNNTKGTTNRAIVWRCAAITSE